MCLSWWIPNLMRGTQTLSLQSFQSHGGDAAGALGPLLISLTTGLFINTSLTHDRALTSLPEEGAMSPGVHCNAAVPGSLWQGCYKHYWVFLQ